MVVADFALVMYIISLTKIFYDQKMTTKVSLIKFA